MFFLYLVRNLVARKEAVLPAALAIMAAVGVTTAMLGLLEGLQRALYESGPKLNAIVAHKGVDDEYQSSFPFATVGQLAIQPGVAKNASGTPMVSPEFVSHYRFRSSDGFEMVTLRGVDPMAFELHPGIKIEGTFPQKGEQGLVVGAGRLGKLSGFNVGDKVRVGKTEWTVTGVLHAPGTTWESEIWADRVALQTEFQRPDTISVAYVRLADVSALPGFDTVIVRDKNADVTARWEREFKAASYGPSVASFIKAALAITVLLGVAAVFTATNTLFALYLGKITELGTLIAMGFKRRRVIGLLLQESLLIAFGSGALGIALALLFNGHPVTFQGLAISFTALISARVLFAGIVATLLIGGLASTAIVMSASRLDVLDALRSG